mgnify:CR=1 FL=1
MGHQVIFLKAKICVGRVFIAVTQLVSDHLATAVKGATVFGVSVLDEFVRELDGILCPVTGSVEHLSGWKWCNWEMLL